MANSFAHGVWFVDLAPLSDPELLPNVIARVLELPEGSRASFRDTLVEWLRPRDLLLILDNCEHLDRRLRSARGRRYCATPRSFAFWRRAAKAWVFRAKPSGASHRWLCHSTPRALQLEEVLGV